MSVFSFIKGLITKYKTAPSIIAFTAEKDHVKTEAEKDIKFVPIPGVHVITDTIEAAINSALTPAVSPGGLAPGTHLDRDLIKLAAFGAVEVGIGEIPGLKEGAAFLLSHTLSKITDTATIGNARDLEYIGNWAYPNRLIEIGRAVQAVFRGDMEMDEYLEHLRKDGFDQKAAELILQISRSLLGLSDLINLRFRGIIASDDDFITRAHKLGFLSSEAKDALSGAKPLTGINENITFWRRGIVPEGDDDPFDDSRRAGFSEGRIDALKAASHVLPNIFEFQDFMVRQVDNEAVVQKFKLDAFIDEPYFAHAKKLGFTRQDAKRLYRFFWNIPSFFVIRSLYSEGKITEQDFRDLLAFARYTPYWIDRMASSLKPRLTQAEIKDRYKFKITPKDKLVPELMANGVAEDLAKKIAELWVAEIELHDPIDPNNPRHKVTKVKTDTIGLIKTAYKDKILSKSEALAHFKNIKVDDDAARLEIAITDYELHRDHVHEMFRLIKEEVLAGAKTLNDAITQLQTLGVSADQLDLFTLEIQKHQTHKPHLPTLAEFQSWHKKSLITHQQFAEALSLLGISNVWRPLYLKASGVSDEALSQITGL